MRKNHHESYIKEKQNLILRAKRIQGQVQALVRALDEERDCSDVLQLMSAARGARCPAARGQECGRCDAADGVNNRLLSGDSQSVTSSVGRDLGVDEAVGELLPEQNAKWVTDLRQKNRKVAMVGDGINRLFIFEIVLTRPARPCSIARRTRENRSSVLWA